MPEQAPCCNVYLAIAVHTSNKVVKVQGSSFKGQVSSIKELCSLVNI